MNAFDEVRAAVDAAKHQLSAADSVAWNLAHLLKGRLRLVGSKTLLSALKRELHDFNAATGKWKEQS